MAYSMSSTNYMTNFVSSTSETSDEHQLSSWDMYVDDFIANNYGMEDDSSYFSDSENSSSMVFDEPWSTDEKCKEAFIDHDLEDTASSPSHSPKVNDFSGLFVMSQTMHTSNFSNEKDTTLQKTKEMESLLETELRKKGLCLVPMSMVVNCLGSNI